MQKATWQSGFQYYKFVQLSDRTNLQKLSDMDNNAINSEQEMAKRRKRSDTKMGTIEKKYGKDFGVRSDKKLGKHLKDMGYSTLSEMLTKRKKKRGSK